MEKAVAIYPWHDLQMLVFAASMDGQGAIAVQASRDYSRMTKNPIYLLLTLVRFGRFEDILVDLNTKTEGLLSGPVWDFAQGYAQLRAGTVPGAHAPDVAHKRREHVDRTGWRQQRERNLRRTRRHPGGRDCARRR